MGEGINVAEVAAKIPGAPRDAPGKLCLAIACGFHGVVGQGLGLANASSTDC